jgi:starch synthase
MPQSMKVLYVSSEVEPFAKTGGLADVAGSLPKELRKLGVDVRVILPKYGSIDEKIYKITEVLESEFEVSIGDEKIKGKLKETSIEVESKKIQVYLLENNFYYNRNGLYVDANTNSSFPDNAERFIFFSRGILEALKKINWKPDIIHCNDWQSGLIPIYLKTIYADYIFYNGIKTVLSIHNLAYQGIFNKDTFVKTGLPWDVFTIDGIEFFDRMNFMKAGIIFSDFITTVSSKYAEEICSSVEYGYGLEGVLANRKTELAGILNGVDYAAWSPLKDEHIPQKYSGRNLAKKSINKKVLLEKFGLPYRESIPVVGMISRLADQKGFDLIEAAADQLLKLDTQMIFLGEGEVQYRQFLERLQKQYPEKVGVHIGFNNELAHLIEAGSDMYLMPSRYEPCGLNQMFSLKYGAVPIVRATGGLDDSVEQYNPQTKTGTGFKFINYDKSNLVDAVSLAVKVYKNKSAWTQLMKNGMKQDFSWKESAKKYIDLYKNVLSVN